MSAEADGTRYVSADAGAVSLDGVCSASLTNIDCWKPDGRPDAELSKHVIQIFGGLTDLYLKSPNWIEVAPRGVPARSLIAVCHRRRPRGVGTVEIASDGDCGPSFFVPGRDVDEFAGFISDRIHPLRANFRVRIPVPAEAAIATPGSDAVMHIGAFTVRLGEYGKANLRRLGGLHLTGRGPVSNWTEQDFTVAPSPYPAGFRLHAIFLDGNARPISEPASYPDYMGSSRDVGGRRQAREETRSAGFAAFLGPSASAKTIELHPTYFRTIRFSGFALEPKR